MVVAIQWYDRVTDDASRLDFEMYVRHTDVQNATELRFVCEYDALELIAGTPKRQVSFRSAAAKARHAEAERDRETQRQFRVSVDFEQLVLAKCW